MPEVPVVTKLAIRFDFEPNLRVYPRMDDVARELHSDFEHWERGALAIELRNLEHHSRFAIQHNRCYFDCDWPSDYQSTVRAARSYFELALKKFEVNKIRRAGVMLFAIHPVTCSFTDLVRQIETKFYLPVSSLSLAGGYELADLAYTVVLDQKDDRTWRRQLNIGPMTDVEWIAKNLVDMKVYDLSAESPLNSIRDRLPAVLTYMQVDGFAEDVSRDSILRELEQSAVRSFSLLSLTSAFISE